MSSNKTSLIRRAVAVSFGLAFSAAAAHASSIGDSYATGNPLTAQMMTNIKNAVNDNDTRITGLAATVGASATTGLQGDVNNLKGNLANGSCRASDGSVDANMVRIGSICIDTNLAVINFAGCNADGSNCTATPSNTGGTATVGMSWAQAARACANVGKRLLTPGEWLMAKTKGGLNGIADGVAEYVDYLATPTTATNPAQGGYIGPNLNSGGTGVAQLFANIAYNDNVQDFISFRCAR
jgi:hypothetical protein